MNWEAPKVVEIRMDAEVGSYQEDFGGDEDPPIVSDRSSDERAESVGAKPI
jgi:hypothetical protein